MEYILYENIDTYTEQKKKLYTYLIINISANTYPM